MFSSSGSRAFRITGLGIASLALAGAAACSSGGAESSGGEVFLAPAVDAGNNPFTPPANNPDISLTEKSSATPSPNASGTESVPGTTPRTYAGQKEVSACDKAKLVSELTSDSTKAQAFAGVAGISASGIPAFIDGSAAVVLRSDTRITNHNLENGSAVAYQYVLQAGTAVLVDQTGMPRVRCVCGNPLLPPVAITTTVTYTGPPWPGWDPTTVVVVVPGPPRDTLVIVDTDTGEDIDVAVQTPGQTAGSPSASTTPSPVVTASGSASPANYQSCARRYGELVRDLTVGGNITPADAQRWAQLAQEAAEAANSGNLSRAYELCWQSVSEMEQVLNG
ncbi:MAG: hypothetical protein Q8P61_08335 [Candidatus Nanopelagicales bacterium]|nr:hypothetical protein [Candidatus Nanopelagicales bacterium]